MPDPLANFAYSSVELSLSYAINTGVKKESISSIEILNAFP